MSPNVEDKGVIITVILTIQSQKGMWFANGPLACKNEERRSVCVTMALANLIPSWPVGMGKGTW